MILTKEFIEWVHHAHPDTQTSMYNHVLVSICGNKFRSRLLLAMGILLGSRFYVFINKKQHSSGGRDLVDEDIIHDVLTKKGVGRTSRS